MRKNKQVFHIKKPMICTHLIFCGFTERKGWFWKGKLVPLSPQYFRISHPRVFSIIPYVYTEWDAFYNTVVVVTACTNRRRSQQSPRQLCHLLLGKKRVASCSFVERCKRICCPSLQGKGAGLDVFYHIPHLSSWCIISRTILQFKNPCLIHLTCCPPDKNINTMHTFPIDQSVIPCMKVRGHGTFVLCSCSQMGITVVQNEACLVSKKGRFYLLEFLEGFLGFWLLSACFLWHRK